MSIVVGKALLYFGSFSLFRSSSVYLACLSIIALSVSGVTEIRHGEVPSDKTCGYGLALL